MTHQLLWAFAWHSVLYTIGLAFLFGLFFSIVVAMCNLARRLTERR